MVMTYGNGVNEEGQFVCLFLILTISIPGSVIARDGVLEIKTSVYISQIESSIISRTVKTNKPNDINQDWRNDCHIKN